MRGKGNRPTSAEVLDLQDKMWELDRRERAVGSPYGSPDLTSAISSLSEYAKTLLLEEAFDARVIRP